MRMLAALAWRSLSRHRGLIAGLTGVLGGFQVLLVIIGANLQREGLFSQLAAIVPPSIQQALGGAVVASFHGLVTFGFFHPIVMLSLACGAIYLASELTGDIEEGLVDLTAARPVPRHLFVTRSVLVLLTTTLIVVGVMLIASRGSVAIFGPPGMPPLPRANQAWLAGNLLAVVWCCGAGGLAVAAAGRRRAAAAAGVGLATVFMYLLHFAAVSWPPARPLDQLSPFHYYDGMQVMLGLTDPRGDILILLAASAVMTGFAYVAYARRDL
jgi:ABC-type transport system involved in multi-copper enzyme maturation permease subunit